MNEEINGALEGVAIIGMAGRFPGATNVDAYWQNLVNGVESIQTFTEEEVLAAGTDPALLKNPNYVRAGGAIEDIDQFAASFFGFTPREAQMTDPQQRIFLECVWEALEDAGYNVENYPGPIGVYAGTNINSYLLDNIYSHPELIQLLGIYQISLNNGADFLCTRVSYKLNLHGPSMTVQTGCSTALVATCLGYQALLNYQADMVVTGGVTAWVDQKAGYFYQEGGISSPDGHCRAFDAKARGTVMGNGVGVVVLKRLEDAVADGDHIYAVIRGAAMNNDGAHKVGYTAPSVDGQSEVIAAAQALAGIDPNTIEYVEAHGTGTLMGDPIEIAALTRAFRLQTDRKQFCGIGSVKTNIGHLDTAAGVAGLIKAALTIEQGVIPPSLNFETPNPQIDFANSPFYVVDRLTPWSAKGHPRRAGVSAFGIGGTNAHVVLEEAPPHDPSPAARPIYPLLLSAQTPTALTAMGPRLARWLQEHPGLELADVAYTLAVGRKRCVHRRVIPARTLAEAVQRLEGEESRYPGVQVTAERGVVFMFPGQGSQHVNMALETYGAEPLFQETVDRCSKLLEPHLGRSLKALFYPPEDEAEAAAELLKQTWLTQPALFVIEYALAELWRSWGVEPQACVGHSIGEYVAACLAGVFSLADGLALVAARGRLMQGLPAGAMLSVPLSEAELQPWLGEGLSLAVINGPAMCVVSGTLEAVAALEQKLMEEKVSVRRLLTSHAFHSEMMTPILAEFKALVARVKLQAPELPYLSNVSGTWITEAEACSPAYWADHLRKTVRFADNVAALAEHPEWILLEVGPGQALLSLVRRQLGRKSEQPVVASLPHPQETQSDYEFLLQAWGQLWQAGFQVSGEKFFAGEQRYRVRLPGYPLERQRYWLEPRRLPTMAVGADLPVEEAGAEVVPAPPVVSRAVATPYVAPRNEVERTLAAIWAELIGVEVVGIHDNFFELGGDSLATLQVGGRAKQAGLMLSPRQIMERPTIAQLAEVLGPLEKATAAAAAVSRFLTRPAVSALHPNLVPLQTGGERPPLFLVHPANGDPTVYRTLARYLGADQPVYGLIASGLYDDAPVTSQLRLMAAIYNDAIQTIQPTGPYWLGGWSAGGVVAFEMAAQLRGRNLPVDFLGLIDAGMVNDQQNRLRLAHGLLQSNSWLARLYKSGKLGKMVFYRNLDAMWQNQRGEIMKRIEGPNRTAVVMMYVSWFEQEQGVALGLNPEALVELSLEDQLAQVAARMQAVGIAQPEAYLAGIRRWVKVTLTNSAMIDAYAPDLYEGAMTFFRPEGFGPDEPAVSVDFVDETRGWAAYCRVAPEVFVVPGHHYVMVEEPHVRGLAEKLRAALDQTLATAAGGRQA